jgi:hypothetical protein
MSDYRFAARTIEAVAMHDVAGFKVFYMIYIDHIVSGSADIIIIKVVIADAEIDPVRGHRRLD